MMAQELNVQVISNNIANMRTTGYKRQRAEFQDLLYEHVRRIGTQTSTQGNILPVGIDLGGGVETVGTPRLMTQGTIAPTGADLNLAIRGEGFFKVAMPDGTFTYTRDGSFQMDAQGRIVTSQGNVVQPGVNIPTNAQSISISPAGQVSALVPGSIRQLFSASSNSPVSSTRRACKPSATICSSKRRPPARRRTAWPTPTASATCSRATSSRPTSKLSPKSPI
jgi:flagellar basal-body rod protein FlgG